MDVETTTLPAREGTVKAQITDEVIAKVTTALEGTQGTRKAVTIGGVRPKEGNARTIVEAVMSALAEQDPPVHVRTHVSTVKNDDGEVQGFRGAVSLTPDGKPSRKHRNNGDAPAEATGTDPQPADPPADPAPKTTTAARKR